jgi:hypothetical protein
LKKELQYNLVFCFDTNSKRVPKHPIPKIGFRHPIPGINGLSWFGAWLQLYHLMNTKYAHPEPN